MRHTVVVGQQLARVLGQAITAVTKRRVVVVAANTRVEAHAVDDLPRVQPVAGRIRVQLVEIGHAQGQERVGKQLDRLGLAVVREQHRHILLDRPLAQQVGKRLAPRRTLAHHNARRVQVVVQGLALAQKFGRENQVGATQLLLEPIGKTHRNGGLDHHHRRRVDGHHLAHHRLHRTRVEIVGLGVVIRWRGDDDKVGPRIRIVRVQRGPQVQRLVRQVMLNVGIHDG